MGTRARFFKMAPDKTVGTGRLPGRKKAKEGITVLLCCNADSTEKYELTIVCRSFCPRVFKKKTRKELGFDFHAHKKVWMTVGKPLQ